MEGGLPPVANPPPPRERRSSLQDAITIKSDKGAAAAPAAAAAAPSDLESLQALLEDRRLRPSNVPVPLKDDPVYGRFIKRKGLTSKAELILEMRDAKLETSVLDLDPDKPLKDQIESADPVNAAEKKRTEDMRRGVKAIFEIFDTAGKGALSTHTLGAAFQKLGVKYTPELLALAMTEFDADNNGALDFEEFYELLLMLKQAREHREEGNGQPAHVFAEIPRGLPGHHRPPSHEQHDMENTQ